MESRVAMDGQPISFAASPTGAALAFASDTHKLVVVSFDDAPDLPTPDAGKRRGRRRTAVERLQASGPQKLPTAKARVVDTCRHEDGALEGMERIGTCAVPEVYMACGERNDSNGKTPYAPLTPDAGISDVTWSPDGQWIAYVCGTSESTSIIRMRHWKESVSWTLCKFPSS
jgi:hypothetical protein